MKYKRVDLIFSKSCFRYLIFSKKECPKCNKKLIRILNEEYVGKGNCIIYTNFGKKQDLYKGNILYKCPECDIVFDIEDLAYLKFNITKDECKSKKSQSKNIYKKIINSFFNIGTFIVFLMIIYGIVVEKYIRIAIVLFPIFLLIRIIRVILSNIIN